MPIDFSFRAWKSSPAGPTPPPPAIVGPPGPAGPPGVPGPPAGVSRQIEIDFGPLPVEQKDFIVVDTEVALDSVIMGSVAYIPPTGKDLDEISADDLSLRFGAGAGQFNINARGQTGLVSGAFLINYLIS